MILDFGPIIFKGHGPTTDELTQITSDFIKAAFFDYNIINYKKLMTKVETNLMNPESFRKLIE